MPSSFAIETGISNVVKGILYATLVFMLFEELVPHCRISEQWGTNTINSSGQNFITPISTSGIFIIMILDHDYGCDRFAAIPTAGNSFMVWNKNDSDNFVETNFQWFAVSVIN